MKMLASGPVEGTFAFLRDPYRFISRRCRALDADLFQTRIQLEKTVCMTGKGAAEVFYDTDRFTREKAPPKLLRKTLFGEGGVQGLDGEAHAHRKGMLLSLLSPERVGMLAERSRQEWEQAAKRWDPDGEVVVAEAARDVLARAVCAWARVGVPEDQLPSVTRDLSLLFDGAGTVGLKHFRSRRARKRLESWAQGIIEELRAGRGNASAASVARIIALHRDTQEQLLEPRVAAVELLNILRPTVAVSVYIAFVALALHEHPECRSKLEEGQHGYVDLFVQEVRRYYPLFPAVVARVRQDFEWRGYRFEKGRRVLLDLYGTNHDPREWEDPERFRPERFRGKVTCPFSFVPQGGGDVERNHRCPGEGVAMELMKVAADFLVNRVSYELPKQNIDVDFSRLPALPRSGFVISRPRLG